jgi:hypothetical protein
MLSSTRTGVTLLGTLPEKTAIAIPGIFGVDHISSLGMTADARTATTLRRKTVTSKITRKTTPASPRD